MVDKGFICNRKEIWMLSWLISMKFEYIWRKWIEAVSAKGESLAINLNIKIDKNEINFVVSKTRRTRGVS